MVDVYFLLGEDVSNSLSPAMMNAAFGATGIGGRYEAISLAKEEFRERFLQLRKEACGINLTIPFKSEVLPLLDSLDEVSRRIGAVNVVKRSASGYAGYNTDVNGVTVPLREHGKTKIRQAILIGAGGAARAFCEAMRQMGCPSVIVAVRDRERGEAFVSEMARVIPEVAFEPIMISELGNSEADLVFNATPLGSRGQPLPAELKRVIYGHMTVFDAVYKPMKTELLSAAEERGASTICGYEMLLNQGAMAFEIWTGSQAPRESMRTALLGSLGAGN